MMSPAQERVDTGEVAPLIYYREDSGYLLTCIARGSDDNLYWVVVENGGWLWRKKLDGEPDDDELRRFPVRLSRDVARLIWGNVGTTTIAVG